MFSFTSPANARWVAVERKLTLTGERLNYDRPEVCLSLTHLYADLHFQAGLQIADYVHHSNDTSKRESIISVGEAVPLHPTHTRSGKKADLLGVSLCLVKSL